MEKPSRERVANKISDIFNPYYASAPFFLVVAVGASQSLVSVLIYWLVTALFFSALPMWDISRRIRLGLVSDAHISRREDRIRPFLFSLGCAVAGVVAVYAVGAPDAIKAVSWSVVLTGAIITLVTSFWKISLHAAGISSIAVVLLILYGPLALPVLFLIPVVFWARLTLKKHSLAQLIAGSFTAMAITAAVFWRFGLIG